MNTRTWQNTVAHYGEFDRSMLYGFILSGALVALGVMMSGEIMRFIDPAGLLLVIGGTFGATLVQFSLRDMRDAWTLLRSVSTESAFHPADRVRDLLQLSQAVKQNGLLVLENHAPRVRDPFFRTGLEIAADGQPETDIKRILETEIITTTDRDVRAVQVLQGMGTYAPALGLIGTLIGLVQLLGNLQDPATVGPSMSMALLTTLYGALLANLIFMPLAGKMHAFTEEQALVKALTVEGVLSLSRQESPLILEQRLKQFMPGFGR
jgi:chemotaxis protein MotA